MSGQIFYAVISVWDENHYGSGPVSHQTGYSVTIHADHDEAMDRAIAEARFCFLPSQQIIKRRMGFLPLTIPDNMGEPIPIRWATDRMPELARRASLDIVETPRSIVEMAFSNMGSGQNYTLLFLQAACSIEKIEGNNALLNMLIAISTMQDDVAMSLRDTVCTMLLKVDVP